VRGCRSSRDALKRLVGAREACSDGAKQRGKRRLELGFELHRKKMDEVLFKIDFEKAYDKVKLSFLQQPLRIKGLIRKWCDLVRNFVEGESVGVKVNDDNGISFTKKGLHQGDPPLLFSIILDMLGI
jgi:hypothetical protein